MTEAKIRGENIAEDLFKNPHVMVYCLACLADKLNKDEIEINFEDAEEETRLIGKMLLLSTLLRKCRLKD